ncbi:MAG: phosphoribosyltransferase [Solirubrobacterales bacterium]
MASLAGPAPHAASVPFADRRDAGRQLAGWLRQPAGADPVVVALPRGGVPVAEEIAAALGAPLEVLVVRKLGAPANPEYGVGAIAEGGTRVIDQEITRLLGIRNGELERTVQAEEEELRRRVRAYRGGAPAPDLSDRTVILVDDGVATGATDVAAARAIRRQRPRRIIAAVPVCSREGYEVLQPEVDEVVALLVPAGMGAVSRFYRDFGQVSDQEVIRALHRAPHPSR